MEVQQRNSTKIYALSNGPSLPEWIGEGARRNLAKRDSTIRRRIELLQDFSMPSSSNKITQSRDGRFIIAAGTYKPRIRCFELDQLSMKFERYTDADIVDLLLLGEDYGKIAILQGDRSILFHAPYGQHHMIRIPTFGRMMAYEPTSCELMVACAGKAGRNSISRTLGGGEVYRINLEEGRFSAPLNFSSSSRSKASNGSSGPVVGGNCISISPMHALTALGGDDGIVRFWDNRVQHGGAQDDMNLNPFCSLDVKSSTAGYGFYDDSSPSYGNPNEVTSLCFDNSGMQVAAGTKGGNVALYDIRSSKPLHVKEHQYGMPIHTLRFHAASGTILSGDPKLVKVWRAKPSASYGSDLFSDTQDGSNSSSLGSIVANIEGTSNLTNFIVAGDEKDPSGNQSGLVLCAGDQPKMQAFYCPVLGSAPKWCSFLDSITEELEEKDRTEESNNMDGNGQVGGSIYEDYKFLTRSEVDTLGIQNLVGTPLLRGYMHGFFIDIGLYNRIRAAANPFEYDEYRKKKIREKMDEKRASRIAPKKVKKAVNSELADRLESKATGKNKNGKAAKKILTDDRFGSLFNNPDFQIDEEDINFKLRNPSGVQVAKMAQDDDMDSDAGDSHLDQNNADDVSGFQRVDSEDEGGWDNNSDTGSNGDNSYDSNSDDDGFRGGRVRGEVYEEAQAIGHKLRKKKKAEKSKARDAKKKKNVMYEADDYYEGGANEAMKLGKIKASKPKEKSEMTEMSLAERMKMEKQRTSIVSETRKLNVKGEGLTREVSYIPKDILRKREQEAMKSRDDGEKKRKRRGIKELGFKTPFKNQK